MRRTATLLVFMALCAAGCGALTLTHPAPDKHLYAIAATRPGPSAQAAAADKSVLKVRPLQISPAYQGKEMLYRVGDVEVESDYYNVFFVQPALALTQQTAQWLGRAGVFGHVVDSTSQMAETYLLEGMVNALYGDFRDKTHPKAVLEMQFFLLKYKDEKYGVVFQKTYAQAVPFSTDYRDAKALAEAYNTALAAILAELEGDLRAAR